MLAANSEVSKQELKRQVDALRQQMPAESPAQHSYATNGEAQPDQINSWTQSIQGHCSLSSTPNVQTRHHDSPVDIGGPATLYPTGTAPVVYAMGNAPSAASTAVATRHLGDLELPSTVTDACFNMCVALMREQAARTTYNWMWTFAANEVGLSFLQRYNQHAPIFQRSPDPNECFAESKLLYWVMVSVGARKYADDPTLLTSIAPPLTELVGASVLSRKDPITTIQALALLCSWPLPFDSMGNDSTPLMAGVLLNSALAVGLHVVSPGRDFSRSTTTANEPKVSSRCQLWAVCIAVCQRLELIQTLVNLEYYNADLCERSNACHGFLLPALQPSDPLYDDSLPRDLAYEVQVCYRYARIMPRIGDPKALTHDGFDWSLWRAQRAELEQLDGQESGPLGQSCEVCSDITITNFCHRQNLFPGGTASSRQFRFARAVRVIGEQHNC